MSERYRVVVPLRAELDTPLPPRAIAWIVALAVAVGVFATLAGVYRGELAREQARSCAHDAD